MTTLKKVNSNLLTSIDTCKTKGYFEKLDLTYTKGKAYTISVKLKELLKDIDFNNFNETSISTQLNMLLEDSLFVSNQTKQEEIELLTKQLIRYFEFETARKLKVLKRNTMGEVIVGKEAISVTADFIFEAEDHIELVKIKRGEAVLSYSGRKPETRVTSSIDLFLLNLLGKTMFPGKTIKASMYHLKSKDDSKNVFSPVFDVKKGKNIVSNIFTDEQSEFVVERIEKLLSEELTFQSERTTDKSKCEMCSFANICNYEKGKKELDEVHEVKKAGTLKLTPSQFEAVSFRNGVVRINAGAGSGKTTVLALRVVELIQEGVNPSDILLITFTNKGAQEMREKISFWLKEMEVDNVDVTKMDILTFNAWGDKILSKEFGLLGYQNAPILIEKAQKYDMLLSILENNEKLDGFDYKNPLMDFPKAKGVVVELCEYFNIIKSKFVQNASECSTKLGLTPSVAEQVFTIYEQLENSMNQANLLDYQDQINLLIHLVENNPEVFEKYSYEHIMIDELQDTDNFQLDIISELYNNEKVQSLMVVGDDSQAIFGFRYTSQEIILNFHKYFPNVVDIFFVENFRSTPQIIQVANELNDLNTKKIDKQLVSKSPGGRKPQLITFPTAYDEYQGITTIVKRKLAEGIAPHKIAVIGRTKSELLNIEKHLSEANIPTFLDISEQLLHNRNVQIMISLVEFFENMDLELNLLEYLYVLQGTKIETLKPEQVKPFVEMFKFELMDEFEGLSTEQEKIEFYYKTIEAIAMQDVVVEGFLDELRNKNFDTLEMLFSYLKKLVLYSDEKPVAKKEVTYKAVVLITAHSSKGKEFDVVINTIDSYKYESSMKLDEVEEERRLLFVSVTRAKKELYVTYHEHQDRIKIRGKYCKFADELKSVERIS